MLIERELFNGVPDPCLQNTEKMKKKWKEIHLLFFSDEKLKRSISSLTLLKGRQVKNPTWARAPGNFNGIKMVLMAALDTIYSLICLNAFSHQIELRSETSALTNPLWLLNLKCLSVIL